MISGEEAGTSLEWKFSQVFGERAAGEEVQEVDIISAIEFDQTGEHLATGDRGGRVVLFERTDGKDLQSQSELERLDYPMPKHPEYRYKTEFQSHEPEFDYLKSLEIEEKINKIRWCPTVNGALFLLSTNDKTIKLWKVQERKIRKACEMNAEPITRLENGSLPGTIPVVISKTVSSSNGIPSQFVNASSDSFPLGGIPSLRLPTVAGSETSLVARCRRIYGHAHDYHINSISNNRFDTAVHYLPRKSKSANDNGGLRCFQSSCSALEMISTVDGENKVVNLMHLNDNGGLRCFQSSCSALEMISTVDGENKVVHLIDGETYISADDLRINLWNLEISDQCFNIVDIKPTNMEELTEVITSAEFHPSHCNMLAYSSSKGTIRLIDMRRSALCDRYSKVFEEQETPGSRSFFTEIIASVSDIKFAKDGRHILSRDFMTLKLWDLNMESSPVATFKVHEYLRPKLCDLYENDSIFDKFECCLSGNGLHMATGSYSNAFRVFNRFGGSDEGAILEASKNPNRRLIPTPPKPGRSLASLTRGRTARVNDSAGGEINGGAYDSTSKLLHLAWHPTTNVIACAASNSLYMYYA